MLGHAIETALAPLPRGYRELLEGFLAAIEGDDRIRAAWLSGSVARGVADAGSDLDLIVTLRDEALPGFSESWRAWLAGWADVIIARELPAMPGSFFATTRDALRVDVVVESVSSSRETPHRVRLPLVDRDGIGAQLPAPDHEARLPSREKLEETVEEFLRQQAIFPAAVVAREDWLLGIVGVLNAQLLLYALFVESNQPLPPMGVKQWSSKLTPEQRALFARLPQPEAERASVLGSMAAVRHAFRTEGRARAEGVGATWPVEADEAIAAFWQREGLLGDGDPPR